MAKSRASRGRSQDRRRVARRHIIDGPSGGIACFASWSLRTGSLRERIAAYANASANLLAQLNELDELREQVRQAQLPSRDTQATETAPSITGGSSHLSGEQRCPSMSDAHERSGLVHPKPAALDRELEAGAVLSQVESFGCGRKVPKKFVKSDPAASKILEVPATKAPLIASEIGGSPQEPPNDRRNER